MIKATIIDNCVNKALYIWINASEKGKDKILIQISVNETVELAKKSEGKKSIHFWREKIGAKNEYLFDGSRKFKAEKVEKKTIVNKKEIITFEEITTEAENPIREKVLSSFSGDFRLSCHELLVEKLKENAQIIKLEIVL